MSEPEVVIASSTLVENDTPGADVEMEEPENGADENAEGDLTGLEDIEPDIPVKTTFLE